jgi:hypothetical protein
MIRQVEMPTTRPSLKTCTSLSCSETTTRTGPAAGCEGSQINWPEARPVRLTKRAPAAGQEMAAPATIPSPNSSSARLLTATTVLLQTQRIEQINPLIEQE